MKLLFKPKLNIHFSVTYKTVLLIKVLLMYKRIYGTKYSGMDQVKFVEDRFKKFEGLWSALPLQIFKGCLL